MLFFFVATFLFLGQEFVGTQAMAVCEYEPASTSDYNQALPAAQMMSHCSAAVVSEVSWLEWFSGKSPSYQFHFFDLLELLYGKPDSVSSIFKYR
ncbi:hypothetical protein [Aestuariibacter sp. A3R04]|uniref:hypothetical protein n=1 Tax=Aestuariibacter sp. A3R04 TaxID=2841571 RepID=UPI001C08C19F|nr:hypothetical protein [Aestuariibacter sp. A3R04]MBU3020794.1 hypothetical protein [Aestuariibacter sp. A3R04]